MSARSERFAAGSPSGPTLHALHRGEGNPRTLVLLHGGGANAHWWDHLAPVLASRFHVVALDFRGHGDSDWPDALEPGAFQRDLEALLAHVGAPDACLVGHSMGGSVALEHAARHAETRAVCAIDVARGGSRHERRRTRLALAARRTYRAHEEAVERFRFLPPAPGASESLRLSIAGHSVRREADGRYGFKFDPRWFGLPPRPPTPLGDVHCPVLVLRGADSTLCTDEGAADLAAALADATVREIPDAGHNVHLERPQAVLRALEEFLALRG